VDSRVVTAEGQPRRVVQPVEPPAGWDLLAPPPPTAGVGGMRLMSLRMPGTTDEPAAVGTGMLRLPPKLGRPAAADPAADVRTELGWLREIVATEARRLRDAAGRPDHERRELLADLASRLAALIAHVSSLGIRVDGVPAINLLVQRLRTGDDLEDIWTEALGVLDGFAAEIADAPAAEIADAPGAARQHHRDPRPGFWKH
ncbi:MAG: Ca-activated chloride channel, partial [Micromonosporaceae bacterium]|nr:Ca-activated chloride channel [Micromonosporaceae bacterium]